MATSDILWEAANEIRWHMIEADLEEGRDPADEGDELNVSNVMLWEVIEHLERVARALAYPHLFYRRGDREEVKRRVSAIEARRAKCGLPPIPRKIPPSN